jgi:hypothetical protein
VLLALKAACTVDDRTGSHRFHREKTEVKNTEVYKRSQFDPQHCKTTTNHPWVFCFKGVIYSIQQRHRKFIKKKKVCRRKRDI